MSAQAMSKDALRKIQVGQLARALRQQLQWQRQTGADGVPRATADQLAELAARIQAAQRRRDTQARQQLFARDDGEHVATPDDRRAPAQGTPARRDAAPAPQTAHAQPNGPAHLREALASAQAAATPAPPSQEQDRRSLFKLKGFVNSSQETPQRSRTSHDGAHGEALERVRLELGDCQRCRLARSRRALIFGEGDPSAQLVFVGEAPGFHEDKQGRPFVGRAGQLFDKILYAMGVRRRDVYLCTVLKCRLPGQRAPRHDEIDACRPFLIKQLVAVKPRIIVALGETATRTLLRDDRPLTQLRGQWHTRQNIRIMPTFAPEAILRDGSLKREVWQDLQQVMTELGLRQPG